MRMKLNPAGIINVVALVLLVSVTSAIFVFIYKGTMSHVPPTNRLPTIERNEGARAQCKDGFYSYSTSRSGTCSGHGGVKEWLNV